MKKRERKELPQKKVFVNGVAEIMIDTWKLKDVSLYVNIEFRVGRVGDYAGQFPIRTISGKSLSSSSLICKTSSATELFPSGIRSVNNSSRVSFGFWLGSVAGNMLYPISVKVSPKHSNATREEINVSWNYEPRTVAGAAVPELENWLNLTCNILPE